MDKQTGKARLTSSHLFVVRIWSEQVGENRKEWRGQVEQVLSGKVGYFREWRMLVAFIKNALAALDSDSETTTDQREDTTN